MQSGDLIDFLRINKYRQQSVEITNYYFGYDPSQLERRDGAREIRADPEEAKRLVKEILTQFPLPKK